jgi:catechol 2,3-dioxygenase-like lactoylglutathione lyase family enzyme
MITSIHCLIYSNDPPVTRAFLRDVLAWPFVEHRESEPGWLIFRSGPSEVGVHPTHYEWEGRHHAHPVHHTVSLMCDDIHATVAELRTRGAVFKGDVEDQGFGLTIQLVVPAAGEMLLYEPKHPLAYEL